MENEVNRAVAELSELNDFLLDASKLGAKELTEVIGEKSPDYLENLKSLGETPKRATDILIDYGIWRLLWLHRNYEQVWSEVADTYFKSDSHEGRPQLVKTLWTHVETVIKG